MNKKGQYGPPQEAAPFGIAHPVLIVGIIIFVIPFFNYVMKWNVPGWFRVIGLVLIMIGALLSLIKTVDV